MENVSMNTSRYTDEQLKGLLILEASNSLDDVSHRSLQANKHMPSFHTYIARFGSLAEAAEEAGIAPIDPANKHMKPLVHKALVKKEIEFEADREFGAVVCAFYIPSEKIAIDIKAGFADTAAIEYAEKTREDIIKSYDNDVRYVVLPADVSGLLDMFLKIEK